MLTIRCSRTSAGRTAALQDAGATRRAVEEAIRLASSRRIVCRSARPARRWSCSRCSACRVRRRRAAGRRERAAGRQADLQRQEEGRQRQAEPEPDAPSWRRTGAAAAQLEEPVVGEAVRVPSRAAARTQLPAMDLDLPRGAGGQNFTAGAISTGDEGFISYQGTYYRVPDEPFAQFKRRFERQQRQDKRQEQPSTSRARHQPAELAQEPQERGRPRRSAAPRRRTSPPTSNLTRCSTTSNDLLEAGRPARPQPAAAQQLPKRLTATHRRPDRGSRSRRRRSTSGPARTTRSCAGSRSSSSSSCPKSSQDAGTGRRERRLEARRSRSRT